MFHARVQHQNPAMAFLYVSREALFENCTRLKSSGIRPSWPELQQQSGSPIRGALSAV